MARVQWHRRGLLSGSLLAAAAAERTPPLAQPLIWFGPVPRLPLAPQAYILPFSTRKQRQHAG